MSAAVWPPPGRAGGGATWHTREAADKPRSFLEALAEIRDGTAPILVPTEIAASIAAVQPRTIYIWAAQGKITNYGKPGPGQARWNLREVVEPGKLLEHLSFLAKKEVDCPVRETV